MYYILHIIFMYYYYLSIYNPSYLFLHPKRCASLSATVSNTPF